MKFTLSWLLEYLDTNAVLEEITDKLTHIGLEVESVDDRTYLSGFTVVEILDVDKHPNADRLKLCKVNNGKEILQIVCGAQNARKNIKTVLASVGSILPGSKTVIQAAKIRNVLSNGMLCSMSELALESGKSDGIIELDDKYRVGEQFFNCDPVIDVNVTPNRGDCLGIYGIARDLSAAGMGSIKTTTVHEITNSIESTITPCVTDGQSFISGRYVANVINKKSPKWLKERLLSIGIRSVSAIVDITNYVMISFGQPLHAYDADKIDGELLVRRASDGEIFVALSGMEYSLDCDIHIVSDNKNIHSIAGIIGSSHSGCSLETSNVFLESAWFNPSSVTKASRKLNISTDSSYRFARSTDPCSIINALDIATKMIIDLCGGGVSSVISGGELNCNKDRYIEYDYHSMNTLGSISVSPVEASNILTKLGFDVTEVDNDTWNVHVPSWRSDITMPVDLLEEIARIYGYDKIKEERLTGDVECINSVHDDLRNLMLHRGMYEVLTWSFMNDQMAERFGYKSKVFTIDNPLNNNFNIMRPSILPSLLQIASDNINHGIVDIAIFEIGPVYDGNDVLQHPKHSLSGMRIGNNLPRNHYKTSREVDIFDVKADILSVFTFLGVDCDNLTLQRADTQYYHPGRSGCFSFRDKVLGCFGELHPTIVDSFDLGKKVLAFELRLEEIAKLPCSKKEFTDYRYQNVKRDFAFVVDKGIEIGKLVDTLEKCSDLITEVSVFDIYCMDNTESNKMSIALSVTFQSITHTLSEKEIQEGSDTIIEAAHKSFGGVLR